jgi:hypothetical protein
MKTFSVLEIQTVVCTAVGSHCCTFFLSYSCLRFNVLSSFNLVYLCICISSCFSPYSFFCCVPLLPSCLLLTTLSFHFIAISICQNFLCTFSSVCSTNSCPTTSICSTNSCPTTSIKCVFHFLLSS